MKKCSDASETARDFWEYLEAKAPLTAPPWEYGIQRENSVIPSTNGHLRDGQGG